MKDLDAPPTGSPGQRAASYWFSDGLPQIVLGLSILISAAAGLLWREYAPPDWVRFYFLVVPGGFILFRWKGEIVIDQLKSRLTYPRTGYVAPPADARPDSALTTLSLHPFPPPNDNKTWFRKGTASATWWCFYLAMNGDSESRPVIWLGPVMVMLFACVLYVMCRKAEYPYRWPSLLALAMTGLVFVQVDLPFSVRPLLPLLLVGGWMLTEGIFRLVRYLQKNISPVSLESFQP